MRLLFVLLMLTLASCSEQAIEPEVLAPIYLRFKITTIDSAATYSTIDSVK